MGLPGVGVPWIKAKLDTGARSSTVHAFDVEEFTEGGIDRVRFRIRPWQDSAEDIVETVCDVHDRRRIRSSSGHAEHRVVVLLDVALAGRTVSAEVTLTNRDAMGFRMLIGRQALRQGFVDDPSQSFLGGRAPKDVRRVNRGR